MKVHTFFRHNVTAHLIDYSINEHNFYVHWKTKNFMACFMVRGALLWWSRTKPALRSACVSSSTSAEHHTQQWEENDLEGKADMILNPTMH